MKEAALCTSLCTCWQLAVGSSQWRGNQQAEQTSDRLLVPWRTFHVGRWVPLHERTKFSTFAFVTAVFASHVATCMAGLQSRACFAIAVRSQSTYSMHSCTCSFIALKSASADFVQQTFRYCDNHYCRLWILTNPSGTEG
jgi:hypothetical protein